MESFCSYAPSTDDLMWPYCHKIDDDKSKLNCFFFFFFFFFFFESSVAQRVNYINTVSPTNIQLPKIGQNDKRTKEHLLLQNHFFPGADQGCEFQTEISKKKKTSNAS